MKALLVAIAGGLVLTGCSPAHQFDITSDEPIRKVELDLVNMTASEVKLVSPHHAVAEANTADSSGEIRVQLANGAVVRCRVGYITNGEDEPHHIVIRDRHCNGV